MDDGEGRVSSNLLEPMVFHSTDAVHREHSAMVDVGTPRASAGDEQRAMFSARRITVEDYRFKRIG